MTNVRRLPSPHVLAALGLLQIPLYLLTRAWGATPPLLLFMAVFGIQFVLYLVAVGVVLRMDHGPWTMDHGQNLIVHGLWSMVGRPSSAVILSLAVVFRVIGALSYPALSSDMFRYVWDGRVQAAGISPYAYPPGAAELAPLRDEAIWPRINRQEAVTIYPPAAQLLFRLIYSLGGASMWAFKGVMVLADGLTIGVLLALLRAVGRPSAHVIIYAWSPLVVYELAANGHMEALMLPCLTLAVLTARKGWDTTAGVALAGATMMKLFPALLLPALWGRQRWRLPIAFGLTCLALLAPYAGDGLRVATYYPAYLREQYNMSLAALLGETFRLLGAPDPYRLVQLLVLSLVAGVGLWHLARPAATHDLMRGVTLIGLLTVFSQFLHPWYMAWLLPFLTALAPLPDAQDALVNHRRGVESAESRPQVVRLGVLRASAVNSHPTLGELKFRGNVLEVVPLHPAHWLGWLLFTGTVVLSYHFYVRQEWNIAVVAIEYLPLYLLLLWPYLKPGRRRS